MIMVETGRRGCEMRDVEGKFEGCAKRQPTRASEWVPILAIFLFIHFLYKVPQGGILLISQLAILLRLRGDGLCPEAWIKGEGGWRRGHLVGGG